mmetsp:Transcript_2720/g.6055  ORF Transcript_2720/g.6055 Transcript_2720/m.6055 type:complete len:122 (-) Transcript_2720:1756-2121(-)
MAGGGYQGDVTYEPFPIDQDFMLCSAYAYNATTVASDSVDSPCSPASPTAPTAPTPTAHNTITAPIAPIAAPIVPTVPDPDTPQNVTSPSTGTDSPAAVSRVTRVDSGQGINVISMQTSGY